MANLHAIDLNRHQDKAWRKYDNFSFAENDAICLLSIKELPKAIMGLPTCFILTGEAYRLIALQGFENNKNLLVAADGSWQSNHLPESYRYYPFSFAASTDNSENKMMCIDEDSGLVMNAERDSETEDSNHRFYTAEGELTEQVQQIRARLTQLALGIKAADEVCKVLAEHNLLSPLPIQVEIEQRKVGLKGLYTVSEEALNKLAGDQLKALRDSGALAVAYCQLLSMRHLQGLLLLARRSAATENINTLDELQLDSGDQYGSLSFENL